MCRVPTLWLPSGAMLTKVWLTQSTATEASPLSTSSLPAVPLRMFSTVPKISAGCNCKELRNKPVLAFCPTWSALDTWRCTRYLNLLKFEMINWGGWPPKKPLLADLGAWQRNSSHCPLLSAGGEMSSKNIFATMFFAFSFHLLHLPRPVRPQCPLSPPWTQTRVVLSPPPGSTAFVK